MARKKRMKLYHDVRGDQPNEIEMFAHCTKCLREKPGDQSPMNWARLNVGITADGSVQIWCARHDVNVCIMSVNPRPGLEYPE